MNALGAQTLRHVRDHIQRYPETFCWDEWDCGTTACFGGHCARVLALPASETSQPVYERFGLTRDYSTRKTPLFQLFFGHATIKRLDAAPDKIAEAVTLINETLWAYGYPPDDVNAPVEPRQLSEVIHGNRVNAS